MADQDLKLSDRLLSWVDDHRRWLFLAVFLVYAAGFNGQWRLGPDTAMYATIGRHLAEGRGYTHPLGQQARANPGMPLIFALNFLIHGYEGVQFACAVMWLMAMVGLALVYRLFTIHAGRPTAALLTLMLAVARYFYMYAFELLTDMPFFVGLLLFLNGYEGAQKKAGSTWANVVLIVLGVGVMALFRSVVLVVFAALGGTMLWKLVRGPNRVRYAAIIIAAVACLLAVRALDPRLGSPTELVAKETQALDSAKNLGMTLRRALTVNVPKFFNDVAPTAFFGFQVWPGQNIPETIAFLGLGIGLVQVNLLWGLLVLLFVLQWLVFIPDARYFLPILPLLMYGWWRGALWCERRFPPAWGRALFRLMLIWVLAGNVVRIADLIHNQKRVPFLAYHEMGQFDGVRDLARCISDNTSTNALIVSGNRKIASALIFYTDRRVVTSSLLPPSLSGERVICVIGPISDELQSRLEKQQVHLGDVLATVPRESMPPWRLYATQIAAPTAQRVKPKPTSADKPPLQSSAGLAE